MDDSVRGRRRYNKTYGRAGGGPSHAHRSTPPIRPLISIHPSLYLSPSGSLPVPTVSLVMITTRRTVYTRVIARTIDEHRSSINSQRMGTHSRPNTLCQKSAGELLPVGTMVHTSTMSRNNNTGSDPGRHAVLKTLPRVQGSR